MAAIPRTAVAADRDPARFARRSAHAEAVIVAFGPKETPRASSIEAAPCTRTAAGQRREVNGSPAAGVQPCAARWPETGLVCR